MSVRIYFRVQRQNTETTLIVVNVYPCSVFNIVPHMGDTLLLYPSPKVILRLLLLIFLFVGYSSVIGR